MQEIRVEHWCDVCWIETEDRNVVTETDEVRVGEVDYLIELCSSHAEQVKAALDLITNYGTEQPRRKVRARAVVEPPASLLCRCGRRFTKMSSLNMHAGQLRTTRGDENHGLAGDQS